jgi:hypothetical protein
MGLASCWAMITSLVPQLRKTSDVIFDRESTPVEERAHQLDEKADGEIDPTLSRVFPSCATSCRLFRRR